jgi:uroporphyrin-III C-methyltransferase
MKVPYTMPGKVYLVGAGPGSAKLLTLEALQLLQRVDMVLHDDLVSHEVLGRISPRVAVHNVGKRCGEKKTTQEDINRRMIEAAKAGLFVVRLKSGDPLIFGRTQEEIEALREEGIPFEIVPGITAASAAAAQAQIPLTERRVASKLVFVSNHPGAEKPRSWHESVTNDTTLVFYMPGNDFAELLEELRRRHVSEDTPCLLVSRVSQENQKMLKITLRQLAAISPAPAPSLLIIGEAAASAQGCEKLQTAIAEKGKREEILLLDDPERKRISAV